MKPAACHFSDLLDTGSVDTHFGVYHELMANKVQEILLVASRYDAYILEEDGSLASKIINEYHGLNLSRPPRLTKVSTAAEALGLLGERRFDLVVAMPRIDDMDPFEMGRQIKRVQPSLPVILLTHGSLASRSSAGDDPSAPSRERGAIDSIWEWTGDADLLLALVKSTEDRMNVGRDTRSAMVRVLLLVEDSPLYRSVFLPLIYREIVNQTQAILEEGLNEEHRLLKMRARPKILVAENYDEAWGLFERYRPYIFGVLSDTRFPKGGRTAAHAGSALLKRIRRDVPHLPVLLLSSEPENQELAAAIPAVFVDKNSPSLAAEIQRFFLGSLGFGDFVFRNEAGGEIGRASDLKSLEELLPTLPDEPVYYEACRNRFSNWFMARSEIAFASMLARIPATDFEDVGELKQFVVDSIRSLRRQRQRGVVVQFSPRGFDPEISDFTKVGNGSLGGKARGIAFFSNLLRQHPRLGRLFPEICIGLPKTMVVTTEGFEELVAVNRLRELAAGGLSDDAVSRRFLEARMPAWLGEALEAFLSRAGYPLSIRSSSLLEDAHFFPYAGLYQTFMIPNNHPDFSIRVRQLVTAVKLVYASTYFSRPRTFSRSTSRQFRKESMAVIVQEATGSAYGDYYYPALSGVARSRNFYPVARMRPEDGVASIVIGMGRTLEEDGGVRFSPAHPELLPHFSRIEDILASAQRSFYALRMKDNDDDLHFARGVNLERRDIADAAAEFPVRTLSSRYLPEEHRLRDVITGPGVPVVTFSRILKYGDFPLPAILKELLELGHAGMGCPVEMEFSVNLTPSDPEVKGAFSVLQMRPMNAEGALHELKILDADLGRSFCYASRALGHGIRRDIADIVYVDREAFDVAHTAAIAEEIGAVNAGLRRENRRYLLAGPGRWGSFDRFLGIPVNWRHITGVGAVIELRNENLRADPSEGSHFFHQLTSRGIHYATVSEGGEDFFDWHWIEGRRPLARTRYLRHIRFETPFVIKTDGRTSRCVMLKP